MFYKHNDHASIKRHDEKKKDTLDQLLPDHEQHELLMWEGGSSTTHQHPRQYYRSSTARRTEIFPWLITSRARFTDTGDNHVHMAEWTL